MTRAVRRFLDARYVLPPVLALLTLLSSTSVAFAGFGITPPYVSNDRLTRGTEYEQQIILVRSDPEEELKAQITMNVPGIESWFTIDKGMEFVLPKGERQVPMVVTVTVPDDAEYKEYRGAIRIRTSSSDVGEAGGVTIALGAQIDVDIEVVDKIYDFSVRGIRMADLEEGRTKWGLFFPAKIRFFMAIENTGNTEFGPTRVVFEIYDSEMETLLETTENTNKIEKIAPFAIKEVIAELPTRLNAGRYTAKYTIYKNDEIAHQDTVNVSIAAIGAVPGYEGYGFMGLSLSDKMKVIAVMGIPLILLLGLVIVLVRRRRRSMRSARY